MTSRNLAHALPALLQDEPVFAPGAALDTILEPAVPTEKRGAGRSR